MPKIPPNRRSLNRNKLTIAQRAYVAKRIKKRRLKRIAARDA